MIVVSPLKKSQKQERDGALTFGGSVRPGSGSKWFAKGDVKTDDFLIEYKRTDNASYPVKLAEWTKIRKEALMEGLVPLLAVQIQDRNFIVIDEDDFVELYIAAQEADGT